MKLSEPESNRWQAEMIIAMYQMKASGCSYEYKINPLSESEKLNGAEHSADFAFTCRGPFRRWTARTGWGHWTEETEIGFSGWLRKSNGKWAGRVSLKWGQVSLAKKELVVSCEEVPK